MKDEKDSSSATNRAAASSSSFILPPSSLDSPSSFSFFPAIPPPFDVRLATFGPHSCSYIPGRQSTNRAFWAEEIPPEVYHAFLNAGFRRSGKIVYQPACIGCRKCISVRVPTATFAPSKSQRRCVRKNTDLLVSVAPIPDNPGEERFALYHKYIMQWHGGKAGDVKEEPTYDSFVSFLYESPVKTLEFQYRDPSGRLIGVGICDLSEQSLSSVYYYYDPDEARRSLGTFGALYELNWSEKNHIPYYYLGYWVDECGAMSYKASFRPFELLYADGVWRPGSVDRPEAEQITSDRDGT
jgi:arginine-tRNA-protein transferase